MNYTNGLSFSNIRNKIDEMQITVTDDELARALRFNDKERFYNYLRVKDGDGEVSLANARLLATSYANSSNRQRWMTEQLYNAKINPQVFMNLLSVVANGEKYFKGQEVVKACRAVCMKAVEQGADIYSRLNVAITREREYREIYDELDDMPSTLENEQDKEEVLESLNQYTDFAEELFEMEPHSPYKPIFDSLSRLVDLRLEEEKAEEDGDGEKLTEIRRAIEDEEVVLNKATYGFEPEMLMKVAKNHTDFVRLRQNQKMDSTGVTLKERKEQAIVAQLYKKAKELEAEEQERQDLETLQYGQMVKTNDDKNGQQ